MMANELARDDFDPETGGRDMIDLQPPRPNAGAGEGVDHADLTARIIAALKTVYDPEIPVDIYELGLVYKVDFDPPAHVRIVMTLTAPGCPVAGEMPGWVETALKRVEGIDTVDVEMTFDPPWTSSRMSDEARLELGWM